MADSKLKHGLGRGFGSLIPEGLDTQALLEETETIQRVSLEEIVPDPTQPRTTFDAKAIEELSSSIREYGVLQPLVVTRVGKGYQIVAGERRWRAAGIAGLKKVPVIVRTAATLERLEIALVENVQRVDLSPLEQAVSIERLHLQFNVPYSKIAKRLGKAETTISNIVRLLQLPPRMREALANGSISEGHARQLVALKEMPAAQERLLKEVINKHWSVRQAELFVQHHKVLEKGESSDTISEQVDTKKMRRHPEITPETTQLQKQIGVPVAIRRAGKGGRLEIAFKNDDELQRVITYLRSLM